MNKEMDEETRKTPSGGDELIFQDCSCVYSLIGMETNTTCKRHDSNNSFKRSAFSIDHVFLVQELHLQKEGEYLGWNLTTLSFLTVNSNSKDMLMVCFVP